MTIRHQTEHFSCPGCQIGHLNPQNVLFFSRGSGYPIVAAQFPGWVCDICGFRAYDPQALSQLQTMLWKNRDLRRSIQPKAPGLESEPQHQNREQRRRP